MQSYVDPDVFPQSWTCHSCNQINQKMPNFSLLLSSAYSFFFQENWKKGFKQYMYITCIFLIYCYLSYALFILFFKKISFAQEVVKKLLVPCQSSAV